MPRVSIIPEDSQIIVNGVVISLPLPDVDPNWRALQYYPDIDRLTIECKEGSCDPKSGTEAQAILAPFIEAHAAALAGLNGST
jgi:hypothetical protein